jgi:hypothetical protein
MTASIFVKPPRYSVKATLEFGQFLVPNISTESNFTVIGILDLNNEPGAAVRPATT